MINTKITRWFIASTLLASFFIQSCTDKFGEINTNPTRLNETNLDPYTLLTTVELLYSGGAGFADDVMKANLSTAGPYVQIFADPRPGVWEGGDKYFYVPEYSESYWSAMYPNQLKLVVELLEVTRDREEYANLHQVARILKAMSFMRMTDLYGDIPYFEAGQAYRQGIFSPKYDPQPAIYDDIIRELQEATSALDVNTPLHTGDLIFNGDIQKWQRLGYSVLLRAGMRLVKVDEEKARQTVSLALGKTMQSNADNAYVLGSGNGINATVNNRNSFVLRGDHGAQEHFYFKWSKTFIDFLKGNNDPRLSRIARVNVWGPNSASIEQSGQANGDAALQKGLPNGKTINPNMAESIFLDESWEGPVAEGGLNQYSSVNPEMFDRTDPTFFLTYGETQFLWAEAALRWGGEFGDPETHYRNGVEAAMGCLSEFGHEMDITPSEITAYLQQQPFDPAGGFDQINTQLWALHGSTFNFYEAWINYRRSGFPVLQPVDFPGNFTGGTIPRRWPYPLHEATNNNINLQDARNAIPGGDLLTSRVWWDSE